ncbi:hypothetical protein [Mesorhizobium sp. LNJC394B00]|uniref:hypothetical protein n=1 Tax=Mesorhizobium sp. LNJC394B00 TaxID=1287274 RepID=UPI0003F99707|nr:hypothetical protein [Mesorhizobium sp. LNJC394B00]
MQTSDGYWWASHLHEDRKPEIIDVHGLAASRMTDDWPYHVAEFELLQHIDTSAWPQKGKLTERELLDENYAVDPAAVRAGYWWVIHHEDLLPLIVLVGKDAVYRIDGEDGLNDFEFLMPIDTDGWPKDIGHG